MCSVVDGDDDEGVLGAMESKYINDFYRKSVSHTHGDEGMATSSKVTDEVKVKVIDQRPSDSN